MAQRSKKLTKPVCGQRYLCPKRPRFSLKFGDEGVRHRVWHKFVESERRTSMRFDAALSWTLHISGLNRVLPRESTRG